MCVCVCVCVNFLFRIAGMLYYIELGQICDITHPTRRCYAGSFDARTSARVGMHACACASGNLCLITLACMHNVCMHATYMYVSQK